MALHVFANIVTPYGTAANNRGETEGNVTTLQKLIWMGVPHTSISAEAIRFALRRLLDTQEEKGTNRFYDEDTRVNDWQEKDFASWKVDGASVFIDDDLLGYMSAEAAKDDASDEAPEAALELSIEGESGGKKPTKTKGKPKAKGTAKVRRGVLEITRAVSITPWPGDMTFNAASPGATASAAKGEGSNPVPYGTEVHATRYQYGLALTPARLRDRTRVGKALRALAALNTVAGNHSRFLFDFAPESIILRVTQDPAPRLLYCFDTPDDGKTIGAHGLEDRIRSGDIDPKELFLGGPFAESEYGKKLREMGATIPEPFGVRAAVEAAVRHIDAALGQEK
jgi:CRISPR-associated protein Cst2